MKNQNNLHASADRRQGRRGRLLRALCFIAAAIILMSGLTGCNGLFFEIEGLANQPSAQTNAVGIHGSSLISAAAKTYDGKYLYCTADDYVALREKDSASSKELDRVPHGGKMTYLNKQSGHWYYVQYNSKKGYVYDKYVTFDKSAVDADSSSGYLYCTADDFVALREKASASSKELARIPHGDKMTNLNNSSGKWYYVQYGSKKGYVYSDYVSSKKPSSSSSSSGSGKSGKSGSSGSKSGKSGSSGSKSGKSGGSKGYSGSYVPDYTPTPNYKGTRVCKVCNGTRKVVCDSCHGAGKFKHTHRTIGLTDSGKTYYTYTTCVRCNGKGKIMCKTCGGDGLY